MSDREAALLESSNMKIDDMPDEEDKKEFSIKFDGAPEIAPAANWDGQWSTVPRKRSVTGEDDLETVRIQHDSREPLVYSDQASPSNCHRDSKLLPHQGGRVTSDWRPKVTKQGLGTFMGVFIPCVLSIVGVVLFLRLGWAVGQAGVMGTLAMFGIGGTMAILTDLSLSAMATNGRVAGGGTYYLLSRSLGPEIGGAIGVVFAAANICGVAFYLQGFTDTVSKEMGYGEADHRWTKLAIATGVLTAAGMLCIFSSALYSRCALFIFLIQMCAQIYANAGLLLGEDKTWDYQSDVQSDLFLTLNFTGPSLQQLSDNLWPEFDENGSFSKVFGIVFPAMTGIMAGTNMSGVLRRPELSIPRGELSAISISLMLYVIMIISLGLCCSRDMLKNDYYVLSKVTWWPAGVTIGICVSTGSSALASIQSAARLLQALAMDDLFPILRVFKTMWNGEPAIGVMFTMLCSFGLLVIGSLNMIAPILTMFMLITYACTNFATFFYTIAGAPNFRPRFRLFSWFTALLGGILCVGIMVYVQWIATVIAVVCLVPLAMYVNRRAATAEKDWGDVTQALIFHQVRKYLLRLANKQHVKFWRARFLLLSHTPCNQVPVFEFMNDLKKGGLLVIGDVVVSETQPRGLLSQTVARRAYWERFIAESSLKAFVECCIAKTFREGVRSLMMNAGLGGMKPNTAIMGLPGSSKVLSVGAVGRNSIHNPKDTSKRKTIDSAVQWDDTVPLQKTSAGVSNEEFLGVMFDATELDMNVLLYANFEELDIVSIVNRHETNRLYKAQKRVSTWFHDVESTAGPRSTAPASQDRLRIDVWECPWGSQEDLVLALQLADMLWRQDAWANNVYIRVCSFVEDDDRTLAATRMRYADLHDRVVRKMRVPATIQVWVLGEEDPGMWSQSMAKQASSRATAASTLAASVAASLAIAATSDEAPRCTTPLSQRNGSPKTWSGSAADHQQARKAAGTNVMNTLLANLPQSVQQSVLHDLISQQISATAVTILPLPALPVGSVNDNVASEYVSNIRHLTESLGPVLLVSAAAGVMTYEL
ncbi:member 9 [Diplonema papillatum]|nr:member 9 [Diplonema papillatum]